MPDFIRLPTRSIGLKFLLVCLLALVMAIPALTVWGVLQDRLNRFNQVRAEIAGYEGGQQRVLGPVLLIPYEKDVRQDDKVVTIRAEAVAFAEQGKAAATLAMDVRKRDLYTVPVYRSKTAFEATFDAVGLAKALRAMDPRARFDFANARVAIGVSSATGVLEAVTFAGPDGVAREFTPVATVAGDPGAVSDLALVAAPIGDLMNERAPVTVSVALALSGAERFAVAAFAKNTSATIAGDWGDPSFEGSFLPNEKAIDADAFTGAWSAPLARRGIAAVGADFTTLNLAAGKEFAVRFVEPTNVYTGVDRALKYSLMFIGLVFLTYFMFEIVSGLKAHPAQYVMVGLSQAIFYLLLLAFAERIGFDWAFVLAAGMTVALISLYVVVVFRSRRYLLPGAAAFVGLYGLMYVLMRLDDYALVVGALTSFAALAALMLLTRNVDWYAQSDLRQGGGRGSRSDAGPA